MFSKTHQFIVHKIHLTYNFLAAIGLTLLTIIAPIPTAFIAGINTAFVTFITLTLMSAYMLFVVGQQFKRP